MDQATQHDAQRGLIIVFTGHGKGKTTAALGLLLRACGHDMRVRMLQFIKGPGAGAGEHRMAERLGLQIVPLGAGFTWDETASLSHAEAARAAWEAACQVIAQGAADVLILDEITYAFQNRWLDLYEVLDVLAHRPPHMHVVLTGRDAPETLVAQADLVTEMREVKHPFRQGLCAQAGIEF